MRIGFLASDLGRHHGWAHYSLNLLQALRQHGVEVVIATSRQPSDAPDMHHTPILPSVTPPEKAMLLRLASLYPQLQQDFADCDLIHTTVELYAPLGRWISGKRPHVLTIHGSYANWPAIRRWPASTIYRTAYRQAHLICVSQYTRRVVQGIIPNAQVDIINHGIDTTHFDPQSSDGERLNHQPTILTVGGVKKRKGTLQLIRALPSVREVIPDVRCVILGKVHAEAHYTAQVQAEIDRLELVNCVYMPGFVSEAELLGWYQQADVFVLPSMNDGWKFEGFGLVHLEASAAGVPVIGTTDNGAEDAIVPNETGLLVDQAQAAAELPDAILSILQNPERAKAMSIAGKYYAQRQTWERVAQQTIAIYQRLLQLEA